MKLIEYFLISKKSNNTICLEVPEECEDFEVVDEDFKPMTYLTYFHHFLDEDSEDEGHERDVLSFVEKILKLSYVLI